MAVTSSAELFFFDKEHLLDLAASRAADFAAATPFPHVVIDDFMPAAVLERVIEEFPKPGQVTWREYANEREHKLQLTDVTIMGPASRHLLAEFNSPVMVEFLEALTGIRGLVPDPHYEGGGLHQIVAGGLLKVHADFNLHPRLQLHRRLNLLLYLNRDWQTEYGGSLELWDPTMSHAVRKVEPVFNRCVVFATDALSYHGHPDPLACPPGVTRKSMALYYYSATAAEGSRTLTTTDFRARPGEGWSPDPQPPRRRTATHFIRTRLAPPILMDGARTVRDKWRGRRRGGA